VGLPEGVRPGRLLPGERPGPLAHSLCEDLSFYKKAGKRSGQMLQTVCSAFERLLVAEGDRRRVRIELHEPEPEEQSAAALTTADYKKDLGLDSWPVHVRVRQGKLVYLTRAHPKSSGCSFRASARCAGGSAR
jgi:hypothetical protein